MSQFFGVVRHEFIMSIRRPGFWISYLLLAVFYGVTMFAPSPGGPEPAMTPQQIWPQAGHMVFMLNIFVPLLAGILSADRLQRDFRVGMRELQRSAPISIPAYVLAKYFGVLASVLVPIACMVALASVLAVATGAAPVSFLWPVFLAFVTIVIPAHAFVVAFSLACPLVMPLRIYQVLFTGYWFWGNMLSPKAFPTISETVLNAIGQYPLQAYFGVYSDSTQQVTIGHTIFEAALNHVVLAGCIAVALFVLIRFIRHQEQTA